MVSLSLLFTVNIILEVLCACSLNDLSTNYTISLRCYSTDSEMDESRESMQNTPYFENYLTLSGFNGVALNSEQVSLI